MTCFFRVFRKKFIVAPGNEDLLKDTSITSWYVPTYARHVVTFAALLTGARPQRKISRTMSELVFGHVLFHEIFLVKLRDA